MLTVFVLKEEKERLSWRSEGAEGARNALNSGRG